MAKRVAPPPAPSEAAPPQSSRRRTGETPPPSGTTGVKLTPVMRQHAEAKAQHPDAILFFRLGDFYEMFNEDAVIASSVLGITLTSRNKESRESEPMCGVPYHAAHSYIAKMIAAGHKVALCEQMADPSKVKGIVPRAVVRVVTPGLVTDDDQLDAKDNHFLAAVEPSKTTRGFGLALLDLSTGELLTGEVADAAILVAELVRSSPREVLLADSAGELHDVVKEVLPRATLRRVANDVGDPDGTLAKLLGFDVAADARAVHPLLARAAAARAVAVAAECSPRFGVPVRRVAALDVTHAMHLDETAQAHLEIARAADGGRQGTLLDTIDRTVTSCGARLLRRRLLAPLADVGSIRARLDQVELFVVHARVRSELRTTLTSLPDIERLSVRVALGQATPRDLGLLRDGLVLAPQVQRALFSLPSTERELASFAHAWTDLTEVNELARLLTNALVDRPANNEKDGGFIRDGFDAELDQARTTSKGATELVVALETRLREQTGAQALRVRYNSVFGWYIEVTKSHLAKVPSAWRRKQTVATGERFTTDELDQLAADIETAEDRGREREATIWAAIGERARAVEPRIRELSHGVAELDVAAALAEIAHQNDYVRPEVDTSTVIDIADGRHPVVEQLAAKGRFVPNDTCLDLDAGRLYLVTGPNMAGKSTLMRQVALIVLLAQAGSYVPAKRARIGLVDRLFSRVGASDNVARGESTFMVEMRETAGILHHATQRSLVILDEIGRGTSTYDGLAIAWAVAEHLHDRVRCRALFATHYHELTELSKTAQHLVNVSVSAREHDGGVIFLHRLTQGPASRSYGIAVAKLAGLPESVLGRARELLAAFESSAHSSPPQHAAPTAEPAPQAGQLGLFEAPGDMPLSKRERTALETFRKLDVDRLTPLDALSLLAKIKKSLS